MAASISIAALRMPEVIRSFSFGSAANMARGNGVRSRIAQMISKSVKRGGRGFGGSEGLG